MNVDGAPVSDVLQLRGLNTMVLCGALPEERVRAQPFAFDIDVHADFVPAGESDELNDTIDYGALTAKVTSYVESTQFTLLEAMAHRVAMLILDDPMVRVVDVTVHKLRPPVPQHLTSAGVKVSRRRGD